MHVVKTHSQYASSNMHVSVQQKGARVKLIGKTVQDFKLVMLRGGSANITPWCDTSEVNIVDICLLACSACAKTVNV